MPPRVPRFKNFKGTIHQHAAQKGITMKESGKQGGDASARAQKKYMEEEELMNEHLRDHPSVAARKRSLGYASEDLDKEIERLRGLGHMKSSAYRQGFMKKIAQMSQTYMGTRPQPNKMAQGPSNAAPNEIVQPYRKKTKMQKYLGRK